MDRLDDPLRLEPGSKDPAKDYQWFRVEICGEEDPGYLHRARRGGWTAVSCQDMPAEATAGHSLIWRGSMVLYQRDKAISDAAAADLLASAQEARGIVDAIAMRRGRPPEEIYFPSSRVPSGRPIPPQMGEPGDWPTSGRLQHDRGTILLLTEDLFNPKIAPIVERYQRVLALYRVIYLSRTEADMARHCAASITYAEWVWAKRDLLRKGEIGRRPLWRRPIVINISLPPVKKPAWVSRVQSAIRSMWNKRKG